MFTSFTCQSTVCVCRTVGSVCTVRSILSGEGARALPTLLGPKAGATRITHGLQVKILMGCILPTMHCRPRHWEMYVASVCTPLLTRMQQLPTMLAQQCCQLLRPFLRVNSSSLYKEWEWINGFHKLKKISLLVTTTQR